MSVSTPLGVKSDVVLPDGSRVRLNCGTRIVYPALFGDERRVEVDGEAYFEVEHDARRPFVVVTGQVVSTVLGTTFNVHAYSEDENYQITLATGSLLVDGGPESRSVRLRPGEQGFFERTSGLLSLRRVNVEQVLSWQEDRLYFRAEPLASIAGASKGSSTSTSRSPTNGCAGSVSRVSRRRREHPRNHADHLGRQPYPLPQPQEPFRALQKPIEIHDFFHYNLNFNPYE